MGVQVGSNGNGDSATRLIFIGHENATSSFRTADSRRGEQNRAIARTKGRAVAMAGLWGCGMAVI